MNKKVLIPLGLVVLLAVIIGGAPILQSVLPKGPTPIPPTPTIGPATVTTCLGGQVFLAIPQVKDYLLKQYNFDVKFKAFGSFGMEKADLTGIDCVWPGSSVAFDEFDAAKPGVVKKHATIFRTFAMIFSWRDYIPALEKIGIVYEKNGTYFMKMKPLLDAINANKRWSDLGAPEIPGLVNVITSDPENSAGGLSFYELIANCSIQGNNQCDQVATVSQLDAALPTILNVWDKNGFQAKSSPELFDTLVLGGKGIPLYWSSESLYLGWRNGLPEAHRKDADKIVGVYPEYSIVTDHVLGGITPNGQTLVDIFSTDQVLQQIGWTEDGMRTKAGGVDAKAGDTDVAWIASSPLFTSESRSDVTAAIKAAIQQHRTGQ
jgi:hypothetical protein